MAAFAAAMAKMANEVLQSAEPAESVKEPIKLIGTEGTPGWAGHEGNYFPARYCEILPAGMYYLGSSQQGPYLIRHQVQTDNLLILPDTESPKLLAEFEQFWKLEPEFVKRGFVHKRGFLLHGPPGSGKSSLLQLMTKIIIGKYEGLVIFVQHPGLATDGLRMVRKTEPRRPIVALLEDFDALLSNFGESQFLALLDGESQVGNIIFIATTNYPERLAERFTARPGRFDTVQEIGMPTIEARRAYFAQKESSLEGDELSLWLKLSDGFSVAHLREMILANRCLGRPIEEVCNRLRHGMKKPPKSKAMAEDNKLGFNK